MVAGLVRLIDTNWCTLSLTKSMSRKLLITFAIFGGIAQIAAAQESGTKKSVWEGVYSAAQAERGAKSYRDHCAGCHREDLGGYGSVLKGTAFMQHWREASLEDFFLTVKNSMPRDAPKSLSDPVYADIVTYILQANGFPERPQELQLDEMRGIRVADKSGKVDIPTGSLVGVVGCLQQGAGSAWVLNLASEPSRTREPEASTPEQLKTADAKPAGTRKFTLLDADSYHPDTQKGHKVEVKGLYINNPGDDRINLTSMQMTGSACGQ